MLPHILPLIPPHTAYIEPFCGGAAVLWAKQKCHTEVINDTNDALIRFYQVAQAPETRDALISKVELSLHAESIYKTCQNIYSGKTECTEVDYAYAVWYLSNFSFGMKIMGGFLMGISDFDIPLVVQNKKKLFREQVKRLEGVTLMSRPALEILKLNSMNKKEVFAYIDPPYFNSECGHYKGYSESDFIELLEFLGTDFKGRFLLSNYPSEVLAEYKVKNKWNYREIKQSLYVNQTEKYAGRSKVETLTWNYDVANSNLLF